ncbi:MAG: hypothetical protein SLAVMIC_00262 [uncultured marine phage]|uniref:Uncharacterized protein n=1 Tax=uncultured marine phage TaxID=707152 RepID=A0A8D9CCR7_9VIRU|nr:MAG: hypothetical protein SLAVMIC_00262 [uncultured marine phage]
MNTLYKILRISLVVFLYAIPWLFWQGGEGDGGIVAGVIYTMGLTGLITWSEVGEIFADGEYRWLISFKLFQRNPVKVINTENGKKYWIGIVRKPYCDETYIVVHKNFLLFWVSVSHYYTGRRYLKTIDDVREQTKMVISSYENELESYRQERERRENSEIKKWDGLVGSEGSIKAYKRDNRLGEILDKPKQKK